jgi:hypothetical protein
MKMASIGSYVHLNTWSEVVALFGKD